MGATDTRSLECDFVTMNRLGAVMADGFRGKHDAVLWASSRPPQAQALRACSGLLASLGGLTDEALDAKRHQAGSTIRQMIEHTWYCEQHLISDLIQTQLRDPLPAFPAVVFEIATPTCGRR